MGSGSFHNETLIEAMSIAVEIGKEIHEALRIKLHQESQMGIQREKFGFIKWLNQVFSITCVTFQVLNSCLKVGSMQK